MLLGGLGGRDLILMAAIALLLAGVSWFAQQEPSRSTDAYDGE